MAVTGATSAESTANHVGRAPPDLQPRLLGTWSSRIGAAALAVLAIAAPLLLSQPYRLIFDFPWAAWFNVVNLALIASSGAVAFNLLLGYVHQVSLAHVAFLIVGAIVAGAFGQMWGLPFPFVVLLAGLIGALIGILVGLPALRLRGLYLLVATLGVHFIAVLLFRRFELRYFGFGTVIYDPPALPTWMHALPFVTADEQGQFLIQGDFRWYWVNLMFALVTIWCMANVVRFREGRAFLAVRDQDVAAALSGIDVARTKLRAFALSSAVVSMSGAMLAYFLGSRTSESFSLDIALQYAIMIVVGGLATISGGVIGAFLFFLAPIFLSWVRQLPLFENIDAVQKYGNEIDLALFGILVIVVLVAKPTGVAGILAGLRGRLRRQ